MEQKGFDTIITIYRIMTWLTVVIFPFFLYWGFGKIDSSLRPFFSWEIIVFFTFGVIGIAYFYEKIWEIAHRIKVSDKTFKELYFMVFLIVINPKKYAPRYFNSTDFEEIKKVLKKMIIFLLIMGGVMMFLLFPYLIVKFFIVGIIDIEQDNMMDRQQGILSTKNRYHYNFEDEDIKMIFPDCSDCTSIAHYNKVCFEECSDIDMIFEDISFHPSNVETTQGKDETNVDIYFESNNFSCNCRPLVHVNEEIFARAVKEKDATVCDEITIDVNTFYSASSCYIILALFLEDETICESIDVENGEGSKNACYAQLANLKKDLSLCENVQDGDPLNPKSICESSALNNSVYAYIDSAR